MASYSTIESWASRLGYIVEKAEGGYLWHLENEPARQILNTPTEVLEAVLADIRASYEGDP